MRISFEYRNINGFQIDFSKNDFSVCYFVYACSLITVVICRVFGLTLWFVLFSRYFVTTRSCWAFSTRNRGIYKRF